MGRMLDRCEVCDIRDPRWEIVRIGDVVVTWSCDTHLAEISGRLQRDHEITELSVKDHRKLREWAAINRDLNTIAAGGTP